MEFIFYLIFAKYLIVISWWLFSWIFRAFHYLSTWFHLPHSHQQERGTFHSGWRYGMNDTTMHPSTCWHNTLNFYRMSKKHFHCDMLIHRERFRCNQRLWSCNHLKRQLFGNCCTQRNSRLQQSPLHTRGEFWHREWVALFVKALTRSYQSDRRNQFHIRPNFCKKRHTHIYMVYLLIKQYLLKFVFYSEYRTYRYRTIFHILEVPLKVIQ